MEDLAGIARGRVGARLLAMEEEEEEVKRKKGKRIEGRGKGRGRIYWRG